MMGEEGESGEKVGCLQIRPYPYAMVFPESVWLPSR